MAEVLVSRCLAEELLFLNRAKIVNVRLGPHDMIQFTICGDAVPETAGQVSAFITEVRYHGGGKHRSIRFKED